MGLPLVIDLKLLLERLRGEEREWAARLAAFEEQVRGFEDFERPAYDAWVRTELGPHFAAIEEVYEEIRKRQILARRVTDLVESQGLHPREALYVAMESRVAPPPASSEDKSEAPRSDWDADEIEARRRAKREAKRSARKEKKQEQKREKKAETSATPSPGAARTARSVLALYRTLARRLHPDAPGFVKLAEQITMPRAQSLWLEVQSAYESRNADGLWAIAAWLDREGGDDDDGGGAPRAARTPAEIHERIRSLARAIDRAERRVDELRAHPAWEFRKCVGSARKKLRAEAARRVDAELEEAQAGLESLEDWIESIGSPRPPGKSGRKR